RVARWRRDPAGTAHRSSQRVATSPRPGAARARPPPLRRRSGGARHRAGPGRTRGHPPQIPGDAAANPLDVARATLLALTSCIQTDGHLSSVVDAGNITSLLLDRFRPASTQERRAPALLFALVVTPVRTRR